MQILHEEIRRITTEFDEFKDKSAKSEKAMTEKIRQLTLENDALKLQIAENNRRFAMHSAGQNVSHTLYMYMCLRKPCNSKMNLRHLVNNFYFSRYGSNTLNY